MKGFTKVVVALAAAIPLTSCLTLAAYQTAAEERASDRFGEPGAAEKTWFEAEGFPVSGTLSLTTHLTRPVTGGMDYGAKETLTCEGRAIRLIPDTPRNRWLLSERLGWPLKAEGVWRIGFMAHWNWPESTTFIREGTCGAGGAFHFDQAPDGRYFVMAKISQPAYETADVNMDYDVVLKPIIVVGGPARPQVDVVLDGDSWLSPVLREP